MSAEVVLGSLLAELGLPTTLLSPLLAYVGAVRRQAKRLGLISEKDIEHVAARHAADSLLFSLVRAPRAGEAWVDVGSGAGFPGLVLACCYPDTRFVLVESMRRRAGFLDLQAARLGLGNVEVRVERAERLRDLFDVAVARALGEPTGTLGVLARMLRPGGVAVLAVGPNATRPAGADEVTLRRPGVDSPGRFLIFHRRVEP